jgi:hypothetical protein
MLEIVNLVPKGRFVVVFKWKYVGIVESTTLQWKTEKIITENAILPPSDRMLGGVGIETAICLEFKSIGPFKYAIEHLLNDSQGQLIFELIDKDAEISYSFPLAELKEKTIIKEEERIKWKFKLSCDDDGMFLHHLKAIKQEKLI